MTKDEFLIKARNIHGYKYNYPNLSDKVISNDIIDIEYNNKLYKQRVVKHINLKRCPEKNTPTKTSEQFISEAKLVWGDKYDYSLVDYKGSLNNIKIIYNGFVYEQKAISHLRGMSVEFHITKEIFIEKAKKKWGDKYDYSLINFINMKMKIKILFNGVEYEQTPTNHLMYAPELIINLKTNEEFIEQCKKIHNNKYIYDKTLYTLAKNKVIIKCPIHGYFEQNANSHFRGQGCSKCGFMIERDRKNKTTEQFISEAKLIWGDKYDYSLVEYKNERTKIEIIHDDIIYKQLPNSHLRYPVEGFLNKEIFFKKSKRKWGDKYDYSLVDFINTKHSIKIIYNDTIYEQLPHNHLVYAPEKILRINLDEFIERSIKFHDNKYSYEKTIYKNNKNKVSIICPTHGEFLQYPSVHYRSGCPFCNESIGEKIISKYLNSKNINFSRQHKFESCRNILPLPFDFYIPSIRTCIEFDGIQHFESVEYFGGERAYNQLIKNDKIKNDYCEDNYINLIRIGYKQIDIIEKILYDNIIPLIKILKK